MSNKKQNKRQIVYNKISDIFRNNPTKSFNYRQISHAIGLNRKEDKNAVGDILLDMAEQKIIRQVSQGKFMQMKHSYQRLQARVRQQPRPAIPAASAQSRP